MHEINLKLVRIIKDKPTDSLLNILEDLLSLSRVAIYRRLRGEVHFSFAEAALIAEKLELSLDEIVFGYNNVYPFKINIPQSLSIEDAYAEVAEFGINFYKNSKIQHDTNISLASNSIPVYFTTEYQYLAKFRYYKWLYENRNLKIYNNSFSDISVPEKLNDHFDTFTKKSFQTNLSLIISDMMLENYIREIRHFIILGMIDEPDIELIKKDLYNLITDFEKVVTLGRNKEGAKVNVYLADLCIDSIFGYVENGENTMVIAKMFGMNYGTSHNYKLYSIYKNSFESLKNYTTLISSSASAKRNIFFKKQREVLDDFIKNN